jgi:hypothetical protein
VSPPEVAAGCGGCLLLLQTAFRCLPVPLQQINLRVPAELLARLRVLARESGLSLNVVAAAAFEQHLQAAASTAHKHPEAPASTDPRIAVLMARVEALEAALRPAVPSPPAHSEPSPPLSGEPITTPQLAEVLGIRRQALNERIRRLGGAREGLAVRGWVCVGQAAPGGSGGPPRWLWRRE